MTGDDRAMSPCGPATARRRTRPGAKTNGSTACPLATEGIGSHARLVAFRPSCMAGEQGCGESLRNRRSVGLVRTPFPRPTPGAPRDGANTQGRDQCLTYSFRCGSKTLQLVTQARRVCGSAATAVLAFATANQRSQPAAVLRVPNRLGHGRHYLCRCFVRSLRRTMNERGSHIELARGLSGCSRWTVAPHQCSQAGQARHPRIRGRWLGSKHRRRVRRVGCS